MTASATKIFVDYISEGLGYELKGMNVDVTSVRPAGITTPLAMKINGGRKSIGE